MDYQNWVVAPLILTALSLSACGAEKMRASDLEPQAQRSGLNTDKTKPTLDPDSTPGVSVTTTTVASSTVAPSSLVTTTTGVSVTTTTTTLTSQRTQTKHGFPEDVLPTELQSDDLTYAGIITPTIYFKALFHETKDQCAENDRKSLLTREGHELIRLCPEAFGGCSLQGSCMVIKDGQMRSFNFHTRLNGIDRFFEFETSECPYGLGVQSMCLDPFYTVAADLEIYKPGTVIFMPDLVGLELPGKRKHDGFLIVRDRGGGIKGKGRFDFFTGYYHWRNEKNPFRRIELQSKETDLKFYIVNSRSAERLRQKRGYPGLP